MKPILKAFRALLASCALAAASAHAAQFVLVNLDPPGAGFNDPTPAAPVGGNPGTTVGDQRLIAYGRALQLWGSILGKSEVPITVLGSFQPRPCTPTAGVLASAGPWNVEVDFPRAPLPGHWYAGALANAIAGFDLYPGTDPIDGADIVAFFNSELGTPACLTASKWYYGLDNNANPAAGEIDFLNTFMHELGHGLGFLSFVDETTGEYFGASFGMPLPDVYTAFMRDNTTGKMWTQMTDAERMAAAVNTGNQVWVGSRVTAAAPAILSKAILFHVSAPAPLVGDYPYGTAAAIGPPATPANFGGPIVVAAPLDGCTALTNAAAVAGKLALIRRGGCTFAVKAKNAQNAGAAGVLIGNNAVGGSAFGIGGADPTVTIPVLSLSTALGDALIAAGGGTGALLVTSQLAGADPQGHVRLYAPNPVAPGSSISHFDDLALPDLLMEPFDSPTIKATHNVDLTAALFADIGWRTEFTIANCGAGSTPATDGKGNFYAGPIFQCLDNAANETQFQNCTTNYLSMLAKAGTINGRFGSFGTCAARLY